MKDAPTLGKILRIVPGDVGNRYAWVDYAKGIAIILVVFRHAVFGLENTGFEIAKPIMDVNAILYSFRMPLFFLLSGLFFHASLKKSGAGNFVIGKLNTLLWPYVIWAVIQLTLQIFFAGQVNNQRSGMDFLKILYQPRALDQLWYLFALFNVTMVYLLAETKLGMQTPQQVLLALVFLGCAQYVNGISTFYDVMVHYVFFVIGTVIAGQFTRPDVQAKLANGWYIWALLPVFAVSQYIFLHHQDMNLYFYAVVGLIGSTFTIMLSFLLAKKKILQFLRVIGNYSLYIYLLHVVIIAGIRMIMLKTGWLTDETTSAALVILIPVAIYLSIVAYRVAILFKLDFLFKGRIPKVTPASQLSGNQ